MTDVLELASLGLARLDGLVMALTGIPQVCSEQLWGDSPERHHWVGCLRDLAWIPVFSSIDNTTAFAGGDRYRPHTSAACAQNSGVSVLVNQPCTRCGLTSSAARIRPIRDAEIGIDAALISAANSECDHCESTCGCSPVTLAINTNRSVAA